MNRLIISKKNILNSNWNFIKKVIQSESCLLDQWSSSFLSLLNKDIDEYQLKRSELVLVKPILGKDLDVLLNPSNILINLISDPKSIDIYLTDMMNGSKYDISKYDGKPWRIVVNEKIDSICQKITKNSYSKI